MFGKEGFAVKLATEPYPEQVKAWPREGHHILAQFDDETVVVFQAYGPPSAGLPLSTGRSARASASPV